MAELFRPRRLLHRRCPRKRASLSGHSAARGV